MTPNKLVRKKERECDNDMMEREGLIFLGSPIGYDQAGVAVGPQAYREASANNFIDQHEVMLLGVARLAHWDSDKFDLLCTLSLQLSQLLIRWSCSARDVHAQGSSRAGRRNSCKTA